MKRGYLLALGLALISLPVFAGSTLQYGVKCAAPQCTWTDLSGSVPVDTPFVGVKVKTSDQSITSSTTFAEVTGLTQTLTPGTYSCVARLTITSTSAAGGFKTRVSANASSLIVSSVSATATVWNSATVQKKSTSTSIAGTIGNITAAVTDADIVTSVVVTTGGLFAVHAAQNVSDATALTIGQNSSFTCIRAG